MKRVKLLLFLLPALILLSCPRRALAETKTFDINKDTYANEAYPDKVNGSFGSIIISNKFTTRLGYLWFQTPELPENAILDRGIIKFYVHERHYADTAKVNVGPVTGDWEENTLTWNNKPTINQTQAIEAVVSLTSDGWKEVVITNLVRQWLEGTAENKGVFIYPLGYLYGTAETEYAFSFKSKESGDLKAKLEVEYHLEAEPTPSPTPKPTVTLAPGASPSPAEEEPLEEETPTPTPEEEKEGTVSGLSTGQMVIGGLILLSLAGAGIALLVYALRKPKKKAEKEKPKPPKKEEESE